MSTRNETISSILYTLKNGEGDETEVFTPLEDLGVTINHPDQFEPTHMKITLDYDLGHAYRPRGYYLRMTPVQLTDNFVRMSVSLPGTYSLLETVGRKSKAARLRANAKVDEQLLTEMLESF